DRRQRQHGRVRGEADEPAFCTGAVGEDSMLDVFTLIASFLPVPVAAAPAAAAPEPAQAQAIMRELVQIPAGEYVPFYGDGAAERVEAFELDRYPVTQQDYLAFVMANPQWRRDAMKAAFADQGYLSDW